MKNAKKWILKSCARESFSRQEVRKAFPKECTEGLIYRFVKGLLNFKRLIKCKTLI